MNWNKIRAACRKRLKSRIEPAEIDDATQDAVAITMMQWKDAGESEDHMGLFIVRACSRVVKARRSESSVFVRIVERRQGVRRHDIANWERPERLASLPYVARYAPAIIQVDTWCDERGRYLSAEEFAAAQG